MSAKPVALVVASDAYIAEDAAELVEVDYEPFAAVTNTEQALAAGAPSVHDRGGGPRGACERALAVLVLCTGPME